MFGHMDALLDSSPHWRKLLHLGPREIKDIIWKKGVCLMLISYFSQTALSFIPENAGSHANKESIGESLCF